MKEPNRINTDIVMVSLQNTKVCKYTRKSFVIERCTKTRKRRQIRASTYNSLNMTKYKQFRHTYLVLENLYLDTPRKEVNMILYNLYTSTVT